MKMCFLRFLCTKRNLLLIGDVTRYLLLVVIALWTELLLSVNVHGHITQNTTWGFENNPYIVDQFLYVDLGVTLTILPGVQVRVMDATNDNYDDYFHWHNGQQPLAKMIIVYGKINAIGTESQPISFDNSSGDHFRRWGGIVIKENAPQSNFRFCSFSHQYLCQEAPGLWNLSAINFQNGKIDLRHCNIFDVSVGIESWNLTQPALVYFCSFNEEHQMNNSSPTIAISLGVDGSNPLGYVDANIVRCTFLNTLDPFEGGLERVNYNFLFNKFINQIQPNSTSGRLLYGTKNSYGNYAYNSRGVWAYSKAVEDTAYCRRNTIINNCYYDMWSTTGFGGWGLGRVFVSDNKGYGNVCLGIEEPQYLTAAYLYNNSLNTGADYGIDENDVNSTLIGTYNVHIYNNVIRGSGAAYTSAIEGLDEAGEINYNTFYGFPYFMYDNNNLYSINNNIAWNINQVSYIQSYPEQHPILSNNCISFSFGDFPFFNGGGNLYEYPLFTDSLNYDFHLQAGSPCIDAGTVSDDMPVFDADYHFRIVGAAPDLGAYEYGSVYIGGISGHIFDTQTRQVIDCAKVTISGKLPEFSDTLGYFTYPTGAGTFTVSVKRFDYADIVIPNVIVASGDSVVLDISMQTNVQSNDSITPVPSDKITMYNYPNPFNNKTNITYTLPKSGIVNIAIYNIKGELIKSLSRSNQLRGFHCIEWDGRDNTNSPVASGVYIYMIYENGRKSTQRMMLIK